jgi:hypothetical protein
MATPFGVIPPKSQSPRDLLVVSAVVGIALVATLGIVALSSSPARATHAFSFAVRSAGGGEVGTAVIDPPTGSYVSGYESFSGFGVYEVWFNDSRDITVLSQADGNGWLGAFSFTASEPPYTISFKSVGDSATCFISGTFTV